MALVTALLALPATAKNLYVDAVTGNDSVSYAANGSSSPWRTIGRAAWGSTNQSAPNAAEAARAGDVVYIAAGTYSAPATNTRHTPTYNTVNSGNATDGHITFEAQGRVVLQHSSGTGPVIGANSRSYVRWRGFYINEANAPYHTDTGPVAIFMSNNIVIENNEVVGRPQTARDNYNGVRVEASNNITVANNRIHGFTYDPSTPSPGSHNAAGIMLYGNRDVTIEHNEIYNTNAAVFPKGSDNYNMVIRYNLIYACIKGVRISYSHATLGRNLVYQNVIRDGSSPTSSGAETMGIDVAENTNNYTFANNTIHNVGNGVYFSNSMNQSNLVFRNNIISNANNAFNAYNASSRAFTINNQDYHSVGEWAYGGVVYYTLSAWGTATGGDAASITANPQYVDAAISNFRLGATSPARNVGIDILDLNVNGNTGDAIHLGAYITGNEQIGRLAGNTLDRPTRVRVVR